MDSLIGVLNITAVLPALHRLRTDLRLVTETGLKGIFQVYFQPEDGILSPQNNLFSIFFLSIQ